MSPSNLYQQMLSKLNSWLNDVEEHEIKQMAEGVELVSDWAQTGLEVNSEDLQSRLTWLKRDLAYFYQGYQEEFKESVYCQQLKEQLWHNLNEMTDKTQIEWRELRADFNKDGIYKAGEEIALGILECEQCKTQITIEHVQTIAPCSQCSCQSFHRFSTSP
jgi:hypothetical protein